MSDRDHLPPAHEDARLRRRPPAGALRGRGCTVDEHGNAGCGRLACPSCGFSGSNLSVPDGRRATRSRTARCGHAWILEHEPAPAAA